MSMNNNSKPFLICLHEQMQYLGVLGHALSGRSCAWHEFRANTPTCLQDSALVETWDMSTASGPTRCCNALQLQNYAALIVLGGDYYAEGGNGRNVPHARFDLVLEFEKCWLGQAVDRQMPVLAICLGSQMLAIARPAHGGHVYRDTNLQVPWHGEIGWKGVSLVDSDPLLMHLKGDPIFFQIHRDTLVPPSDAIELAQSTEFGHCDAFRIGNNAYGFQFHPEVDTGIAHEWLARKRRPDEVAARKQIAQFADKAVNNARPLFDAWVDLALRSSSA